MSKGECRHPQCIYRNTKKGAVNNCDYALITGRVRTPADKPLDNRHCEYYVPMKKLRRVSGRGKA